MRMIKNTKLHDCGVCAVANLLDISWRAAAHRIWGNAHYNRLRFNTRTKQVATAIDITKPKLIRVKSWHDIPPERAIVKVIPPECEGGYDWHWVVWRDGKVWDSCLTRASKPEHYECRLVSYLGSKT